MLKQKYNTLNILIKGLNKISLVLGIHEATVFENVD